MKQPTPEQEKKIQEEVKKQFQKLKKTLKARSKSELIGLLWEQGLQFKQLQDISQQLYEENKILKEKQVDKPTE